MVSKSAWTCTVQTVHSNVYPAPGGSKYVVPGLTGDPASLITR